MGQSRPFKTCISRPAFGIQSRRGGGHHITTGPPQHCVATWEFFEMTRYPKSPRFTTRTRLLLLAAPQAFFLLVADYFSYRHIPYDAIILLTVLNTVYFHWWATLSYRYAWYSSGLIVVVFGYGAALLAALSIFYFYLPFGVPL
jgi:hypothetical protein